MPEGPAVPILPNLPCSFWSSVDSYIHTPRDCRDILTDWGLAPGKDWGSVCHWDSWTDWYLAWGSAPGIHLDNPTDWNLGCGSVLGSGLQLGADVWRDVVRPHSKMFHHGSSSWKRWWPRIATCCWLKRSKDPPIDSVIGVIGSWSNLSDREYNKQKSNAPREREKYLSTHS